MSEINAFKTLEEFEKKLKESQQPLEPEFGKIYWENRWELYE